MSSLLQESAHATGVANADFIEVTIGTGHAGAQALTVGARLIISAGSYNNAQIDASHFSQQGGTATLGSFVVGHSEKRSGDGFSIAIVSAVVTGAGTATIRMDVTGNNYQNMHIGEWSGLGPMVYHAGGQNSTGTAGSTSTMNSAIYGRAFGAWTNATGTVTITPEGTWTDIHDFEDNSTTLCLSVISKAVSPGDAVTPEWTLSAGSSWIAAGAIYAEEQPDVFDFGGKSSPSPNTAVQSQTLTSPYMIEAGSRIYVAFAPWSTAANAAIDPTIAMVSDNLGNAASSYERLILLDTATYAGSADPNVPGIAWFESPAIASDVGAPTVTIDIDPGGSGTGYWTGGVLVIKNPSTDDETRIAAAVSDYRPTISDPGTIPTIVPFASGDRDTDHSVVACFGFNRGHDDGADIEIPTQGGTWTKGQAWNEESSQFWSGLLAWLETTDTGSIAPTMVISRNDGDTVTKTRGVMVIVNLADGNPVGGGTDIAPAAAQLSLSSAAPTRFLQHLAAPAVAALLLSTAAPTVAVTAHVAVSPAAAQLSLSTTAPSALQDHRPEPSAGQLTLSATAPARFVAHLAEPSAGQLTLSTVAPTALQQHLPAPAAAQLVLSGTAPTVSSSLIIAPSAGQLALSATAPDRLEDHRPATTSAQLTLTTTAPSLGNQINITPDAGQLAISLTAPTRVVAHLALPASGDLALSSTSPSAVQGHRPAPSTAQLTLTTTAPSLGGATTITTDAGQVTLSATAPSVVQDHRPAPGTATLTLDATAPVVTTGLRPDIGTGTLTLTTTAPTVKQEHFANPVAGQLVLSTTAPLFETPPVYDVVAFSNVTLTFATLTNVTLEPTS